MLTGRMALIAVGILAASIWVGSLVCLALVAAAARRELDGPSRVALFRRIGRLYGFVGSAALVIAIGTGLVLAWPPSSFGTTVTSVLTLSGVLVVATAAGMVQARRMTRERQRLLDAPDDQDAARSVRRGAALAEVLRGSIGLVTLVIIILGAHILDR
jgi:uncharacterized membrane protein